MRQMKLLDKGKSASGSTSFPKLKEAKGNICPYLTDCINSAMLNCEFPGKLNKVHISSMSNDLDPTLKSNFKPSGVLSAHSKTCEIILKRAGVQLFQNNFGDILCHFRRDIAFSML